MLVDIPVPVYLVRTDAGENVLVDTGMHPSHVDDPHQFRFRSGRHDPAADGAGPTGSSRGSPRSVSGST